MLVSKVGAIMGQRKRNPLGYPPISSQLRWIAGTMASLDPLHSLQLNKMLEKRGGKGACKGKGSMVGTLRPLTALGSCLSSFSKSEWPLELLQNPSNAQQAIERPTTRGCRSVPRPPHILITLAGLSPP